MQFDKFATEEVEQLRNDLDITSSENLLPDSGLEESKIGKSFNNKPKNCISNPFCKLAGCFLGMYQIRPKFNVWFITFSLNILFFTANRINIPVK